MHFFWVRDRHGVWAAKPLGTNFGLRVFEDPDGFIGAVFVSSSLRGTTHIKAPFALFEAAQEFAEDRARVIPAVLRALHRGCDSSRLLKEKYARKNLGFHAPAQVAAVLRLFVGHDLSDPTWGTKWSI